MSRPTILCVDDETRVLDGLRRILHGRYDVTVASGPAEALALLDRRVVFDVVVSDMRMPGMSGAQLLALFRQRAPDTVRMLLTGQSELDAAIAAVNEGQVFRFLTKPCPPELMLSALAAGVEQHRLVTAERELLEKTLVGSIRAMTDVLALAHPHAFGPTMRQHGRARRIADRLGLPDAWRVEVASMLGSLGYVVLPEELLERLRRAETLAAAERKLLDELPTIADGVISKIPRLEEVAALVRHQASWLGRATSEAGSSRALPMAAAVLRVVHDLSVAEETTGSTREAIAMLRTHAELYDPRLLDAAGEECAAPRMEIVPLPLAKLRPGMVLVEDVKLDTGMLLVARGQRVTEHLLLRLANYARRVREPILCEIV